MSERCTMSILQRLPIILAVTAASYGLPLQANKKPPEGGSVSSRQESQLQLAGAV